MNIRITITRAVNCAMEADKRGEFRKFIDLSVQKFLANDWGTSQDKELNDGDPMSAMGVYKSDLWVEENTLWIKSDDYRGTGETFHGAELERVVTIMFPSDY